MSEAWLYISRSEPGVQQAAAEQADLRVVSTSASAVSASRCRQNSGVASVKKTNPLNALPTVPIISVFRSLTPGTGRTRNGWQAIAQMVKRLRRRANLSRVSARPLQRIAPMRVHATGLSLLIQMDRAPLARSAGSNGAVLPRGAISEVYRAGPDFASRAVACRRIYSGPLKDGLRQADRHAGIRTGWSAYV